MLGVRNTVVSFVVLLALLTRSGDSRRIPKYVAVKNGSNQDLDTNDRIPKAKHFRKCTNAAVAIFAARTNDFSEVGRLPYPELPINNGDAWDRRSSMLTVPQKSTYFFHLNAGAHSGQPVNLTLQGMSIHVSLERRSVNHDGHDTLGRNFIATLAQLSRIYVDNDMGSIIYSQGGRQTSFTAFDIEAHMATGTATVFSVARDTPYTAVGEVIFPKEFVNIGQAFDSVGQIRFRIMRTGVYFFTLSLGVRQNMNVRVQIKTTLHAEDPLAELWRSSDSHDDNDVISTAVMAVLRQGDEVYTDLRDGEIHADGGHQTFFGGFLYDTASGVNMAWSVYSSERRTAIGRDLDPLPFDGSWVNTNQMFDFESNTVNITQSGLYYVTLSIGALEDFPPDVSIMLDRNRVEMNIFRDMLTANGPDTLNQGAILRLSAGNYIRVVLGEGSASFSDGDHQTVFTGFLINPE